MAFRHHADIQQTGIFCRVVDRCRKVKFLCRTGSGELTQAAQGNFQIACSKLNRIIEIAKLTPVPDLDGTTMPGFLLPYPDPLRVITMCAKRRRPAGADPLTATLVTLFLLPSIYRLFNPGHASKAEQIRREHWEIPAPPPVPTTAIFSRWDGVCHWRACIQHGGHEQVENIEVIASHTGMAVNPQTLFVIADRLAQRRATWMPFRFTRPSDLGAAGT